MAERLTQWFGYGKDCRVAGIASHLEEKHTAEELVDLLATRLAAYEDTGLAPEDIGPIFHLLKFYQSKFSPVQATELFAAGIDHILELLQAETAGRLLVLPCKVGDTVYVLGECVVSEIPVLQIFIEESGCFVCAIGDFRGGNYPTSAFGKTVFLTREEAEAALKGGGADG